MDYEKDVWAPLLVAVVGGLIVGAIVETVKAHPPTRQRFEPVIQWFGRRPWVGAALLSLFVSLVFALWPRPSPPSPVSASLPNGAIVAFNEPCKAELGWRPFREGTGRFIIGAGADYTAGYDTWQMKNAESPGFIAVDMSEKQYKLMSSGGEARHQLSIAELPKHRFSMPFVSHMMWWHDNPAFNAVVDIGRQARQAASGERGDTAFTEYMGQSTPHSILPPYIALYWCEKVL